MYVCLCTKSVLCVHTVSVEARGGHQVSCCVTLYLIALWQVLTMKLEWGWQSVTQQRSYLCPSSNPYSTPGVTDVCGHAWLFIWVLGIQTVGPHACRQAFPTLSKLFRLSFSLAHGYFVRCTSSVWPLSGHRPFSTTAADPEKLPCTVSSWKDHREAGYPWTPTNHNKHTHCLDHYKGVNSAT